MNNDLPHDCEHFPAYGAIGARGTVWRCAGCNAIIRPEREHGSDDGSASPERVQAGERLSPS